MRTPTEKRGKTYKFKAWVDLSIYFGIFNELKDLKRATPSRLLAKRITKKIIKTLQSQLNEYPEIDPQKEG